ncbi:hypothetical protein CMI37_04825 [Candidatus Pacearchaeota archaeon]|nr:hypothetical protein [Candidatus Pacearchaeota archaeon]|tara:strand:- start:183 stop:971 length:789 start_codon:yes stop_codon:yes gene_type:complete
MKDTKVCLVVAFYEGLRDRSQHSFGKECADLHKKFLKKYKHNLDTVFFVFAEDGRTEVSVVENKEENITYIYRPNEKLSFGSWVDVCRMYRDKFDYYILTEDDYLFVKDDFDKIMVDQYEKHEEQYMVTWRRSPYSGGFQREEISTTGIISKCALSQIGYFESFFLSGLTSKGACMIGFLDSFSGISSLDYEYDCWPYYHSQNFVNIWGYDKNLSLEANMDRVIYTSFQFSQAFDGDDISPERATRWSWAVGPEWSNETQSC